MGIANKAKWAISIALTVILIFVFGCAMASEQGKCGQNARYLLDDNGLLTISGTGEVNSHPWTDTSTSQIKQVVVSEGITRINKIWAFKDCTELVSVALPATMVEIDGEAFLNCTSLTTVVIPEGL